MRTYGLNLGAVCDGRDNNLNLIRMVAALAVLVSHAWPIALGPQAVQPLERLLGPTLGSFAVYTFFAISGFLIARSFERQPTVARWALARVLRLFPALAVVLVLTVLVLGPLVTTLPLAEYFRDPRSLSYVPRNLSLALMQYPLPGVFEDLPYGSAINGSLWTLFYEVLCYGGVLVAGLLGMFRDPRRMILGLAAFALGYAAVFALPEAAPGRLVSLLGLALPFAIGVGFHVWRHRIRLHPGGVAALAVLTALAAATPLYTPLLVLTLVYGVFVLGYMPGNFARRYNRLGDYSYGVYIYAFPMQQLAVYAFGPMEPLGNIALALPPTLALAIISWVWVEKPALALLKRGSPRVAPSAPARVPDI